MAITVKFYSFAKKINSTATLPAAAVPVYSTDRCLIKSGSQIVSPDLEIALPAATNISAWNYAHIPNFSRYYFVVDATYDNGQWVFHMQCDVLATYKAAIGSSTQYVARSYSAYDTNIIDTAYAVKANPTVVETVFGSALAPGYSGTAEQYVVGVLNNDSGSSSGCVSYYAMTTAQVNTLKQLLLTDNNWIGNVDSGTATPVEINQSKVDINPMQYIVSCKHFPVAVATSGSAVTIRAGWWSTGATGKHLASGPQTYVAAQNLNNLHHPQAGRGNYLNSKAFCSYSLDFAGVHFDLDADVMAKCSTLSISVRPDYITGDANFKVYGTDSNGADYILANVTQPFAADIPLGQITTTSQGLSGLPSVVGIPVGPIMDVASHVGQGISSLIRKWGWMGKAKQNNMNETGGWSDKFTQGVTGVATALGMTGITGTYSGTPGSMSNIWGCLQPVLKSCFKLIADENLADYGRPLCQRKTISSLSGFVLCAHAEIGIATATANEISEIIDFLEGGFFYE